MIAIFCLLLLVLFVVEETQARGFDVMQETKGDDETTGDDGDTKPGEKMTMGDEETTGDDGDTKPGAPMKGAGETDDFDDFPDVTRKKHITFIRLLFEMLIIFQKTKQNKTRLLFGRKKRQRNQARRRVVRVSSELARRRIARLFVSVMIRGFSATRRK